MRIAVISPHAKENGNTVVSMLVALQLAHTGKLTCLSHISPLSNSFSTYLNFIGFQDKTSTPSQIVKVLKEGGLDKNDVSDYCKRVADNLEAFTNQTTNFTQEDMDYMYNYMISDFPHENVVLDVDVDDMDKIEEVCQNCDIVILNLTQNIVELQRFKDNREEYSRAFKNKPLIVVINRYNSTKGSIKETANWMGIKKPNGWLVLHENPWITWATNHGRLGELFRQIEKKDARVIELASDLTKLGSTVLRAKTSMVKKSGGRK